MVSILATKLHIPRPRANAVSRPRLTGKLLSAVQRSGSFVLLSGPAGFGKTTLLGEFIRDSVYPVGWLSLDDADNDPIRFWTYFITAIQSIQQEIGESALALLQTSQPLPDDTIPALLINDLVKSDDDLVLVLDDYHSIQNPSLHAALSFLLDHLPDNLHLIVSTRVDPPWPLARFRVRDQLVEIRAMDLRFTTEETADFLNRVMGLDLSTQHVTALEERTEGWIASLQLAAISMRGRSDVDGFINAFTGSHVYVAEYLMEEVLGRQPEDVRDFLFQTCILERLNASLCNILTGRSDSGILLKDLYQANLFLVPLDEEGQWFRYHHLFADLLRARLQQTSLPDEISALHQRAMTWFDQNGFPLEAMSHALAARDYENAVQLVEKHALSLMTRGELTTLLRWTEALPESIIQLHPALLLKKAWALTLAGAVQQVEPLLKQAQDQIQPGDNSATAREVLGNAAAIRAFFAMMTGNYPTALELAKHADTLLPEGNAHISWLVPYTLGAVYRAEGQYEQAVEAFTRQANIAERNGNSILWATGVTEVAIVRRLQGRLRDTSETCLRALASMAERGETQFGSLAKLEVPLIEVLRDQNELGAAQRRLNSVIERMRNWPMPTDRIFAYLAQIRLQEAQGDISSAFETLRMAQELKAKHPVLMNLARSVDMSEIRLHLKGGTLDHVARLMDDLQPGRSPIASVREQELLLLARLRLAQGNADEANQILSPLAKEAEAAGRIGALIEILALQAVVLCSQRDQAGALLLLNKALAFGEPEGFMRVFLDEGEVMQEMLAVVARKMMTVEDEASLRLRAYISKLLDAFPSSLPPEGARSTRDVEAGLIEPLTPRELQVLQRIAAGDSNQTIADKFVITLSAVKKHTGNIYGKLNVNSRTQAIARARQLGLIGE